MLAFILFLGSIAVFLFGGSILLGTETVMHEITAMLVFLIAAVLFTGAFICDEVRMTRKELKKAKKEILQSLEEEDSIL